MFAEVEKVHLRLCYSFRFLPICHWLFLKGLFPSCQRGNEGSVYCLLFFSQSHHTSHHLNGIHYRLPILISPSQLCHSVKKQNHFLPLYSFGSPAISSFLIVFPVAGNKKECDTQ